MAARFVHVDHAPPHLLSPDLRDWGSKDHMIHFIMDAVVGDIENVLVDSGYYSEAGVTKVEDGGCGPTVYSAIKRTPHGGSVAQLEEHPYPLKAPWIISENRTERQ